MLRTAKNRKISEIQESLPSIREEVAHSVDREFQKQFGLISLFDKGRSLRFTVLGSERPSDSLLDDLAAVERQIRILGFDIDGVDKVYIVSGWREHERQVLIDQQVCARLREEREKHLKLYDDATSRVRSCGSLSEAQEIVDAVLA